MLFEDVSMKAGHEYRLPLNLATGAVHILEYSMALGTRWVSNEGKGAEVTKH